MQKDDKCAICSETFSSANIAWIMSECMHNICNICLKRSMSQNVKQIRCLQCKIYYNVNRQVLQEFPKNITIYKKLKGNKYSSHEAQIKQNTMLLNQISMRTSLINCTAHNKPLDIICTNDKQLLCSHCAIFGSHQNHTFKTLDQFQKLLKDIKLGYKNLQIKKQIFDEGIRSKKYRTTIINKINQKKDQLISQIKNKFNKLNTLIKDAQRQVYDDLTKNLRILQSQIGRITKQQQSIQKNYNQWKTKTQQYLQQIDKSQQLKQKISVFYRGDKPNIADGQKLLTQIQQNNQAIKLAVNQKINSISIQYTQNIQGSIYNFAKVLLSQKQLKGKDELTFNPITQFDQIQQSKRAIKIQFVKSPQIQIDNDQNTNIFTKPNPPIILNRVKSDQKLTRTNYDRLDTYKPSVTPQKYKSKGYVKHEQHLQNANKMLNQFIKSIDTLDISGCDLNDEQIIQIVKTAATKKSIKCIKICKNKLTNQGLAQILQYIPNVTSVNLSYNLLTDLVINLFIDKRENLPLLRIINFSHNKINQRKIKTEIDQLKKVGIITIL